MLILYRIYQIVVMIPLLLVLTTLTALLTIVACALGGARWWGYHLPKWWARLFCALSLVRVRVRGRDNISTGRSYVFVANHQGAYDIFAIYGYLGHNFRWMMKKSLERIPLVGYSCRVSGHIYVDNRTPHAIRQTMQTAERRLAGGMSVVVFPEGARTPDGRLKRFKRGAYILAEEFGLPVVPVTIDGAYSVMPRQARLPRWGTITLTIHRPIEAPEAGHSVEQLIAETRAAIAADLPEWQR
ncbi:MAG: 1-acyl-sn-glycerol-3-phosphate acyltransferase [Bacteroides sp.]|nr:1-acyl-sn-glycerol-3-phosphate acyltransferase [Bacteroides sp.]MCM1094836.1 1-acyl-sn-glycerol-3-phosphate acyltransferase [Terasakiella sp.]